MNSLEYEKMRLKALRGHLTLDEEAHWQAHLLIHPEAQQDWEEEQLLNQSLKHLPDVPLASNFTARVMSAVDRETREAAESEAAVTGAGWWHALGWSRQIALASVVLCVGLLGYRQYQLGRMAERAEVARGLAEVSSAADLPSLEILRDFEAIRRLSQMPPAADAELAAALQ